VSEEENGLEKSPEIFFNPTQVNRRRCEIWPPKFQLNRFTRPASRRPSLIKISWSFVEIWRFNEFQDGLPVITNFRNVHILSRAWLSLEFQICCCVPIFFQNFSVGLRFGQTPITAKCSMCVLVGNGRYHGNCLVADVSGRWCMRPPTFRLNWSIGRRVIAFSTFSNIAAVRHLEFKKNHIGHVTIIGFQICCCVPNIKISSGVWPPNTNNC